MPRLIFAKKAATQALLATVLISTTTVLADEVTVNYDIIPRPLADTAVLLRERALLDNLSVDIVESLTTEVGARRVGTDGDKRQLPGPRPNSGSLASTVFGRKMFPLNMAGSAVMRARKLSRLILTTLF